MKKILMIPKILWKPRKNSQITSKIAKMAMNKMKTVRWRMKKKRRSLNLLLLMRKMRKKK